MKKLNIVLGLIVAMSMTITALGSSQAHEQNSSAPQTDEEPYLVLDLDELNKFMENHYALQSDLVKVIELEDPDGIDLNLLPSDIVQSLTPGTRVVKYIETKRLENSSDGLLQTICFGAVLGIPCRSSADGGRDLTTYNEYQSFRQYLRSVANRYDWYSRCVTNCLGWEIIYTWGWWTRPNSNWSVSDAEIGSYIDAEDFCTEDPVYLNRFIHPSVYWYGNETLAYSPYYPSQALVPWPSGWSKTQGDIYYGATKILDDWITRQYWPRDG